MPRPRSLVGLVLLASGLLLFLNASGRAAASSALARAGVSLPETGQLREGLSRWRGSWAGGADAASAVVADDAALEAGQRNDVF